MSEYLVELEKICIKQGRLTVLSDVDLNLKKGEFVYILGKTGTGKSSLLRFLYADLPYISGDRASVCDFDLDKITPKTIPFLRRKLGIVFQDFQLLTDRNVYNNLAFVLKAVGWKKEQDIDTQIESVLKKVNMTHRKDRMSYELSGGEQQRVAIARALLNNPELIIADEPTGNLDPHTSEEIVEILEDVHKNSNTSILMSTHNFYLVSKYKHRIIKCEGKSIFEHHTTTLQH